MVSRFGRRKVLSARDQLARMRGVYPHFHCRIRDGALVAEGEIRPTARSISYRVRIEYRAPEAPKIYVISPGLKPREEGGRIPHVYPGNRPCLYLPNTDEWSPDLSLAHTIVPWISEWLYFYETWHAIGVWLGGGVEPADNSPIRNDHEDEADGQNR